MHVHVNACVNCTVKADELYVCVCGQGWVGVERGGSGGLACRSMQ